ncbi:MAG: 50S ribosomal protein L24 [Clostridiales bacterium]|nr:50S ribosomal protein L24 [Clostridiales bacterium]
MSTMKIKVGDTVKVITGTNKGAFGKVIKVDAKNHRVVLEGEDLKMITKHNKQSAQNPNGGIVHLPCSIDISNVMYVANEKAEPTRVGFEGTGKDKKRVDKKAKRNNSANYVID